MELPCRAFVLLLVAADCEEACPACELVVGLGHSVVNLLTHPSLSLSSLFPSY